MNLEKEYLLKTAKLVSDTNVTDHKGILCVNYNADKKIYFSKTDAKNQRMENKMLKQSVCDYCRDIYKFYANNSEYKAADFYKRSAEFYEFAIEENLPAEELYKTSQNIRKNGRKFVESKVKSNDFEIELVK